MKLASTVSNLFSLSSGLVISSVQLFVHDGLIGVSSG